MSWYGSDDDFYHDYRYDKDSLSEYSYNDHTFYDHDDYDIRQNVERVLHIYNRNDSGLTQGSIILLKLDDDRKSNKHCDVIIKVRNGEINAHRAVLAAASDYFDVMFSHDTKESQYGVVELIEMNPVSVKKCIDYIYTGRFTINEDEWEDILYVARMMLLTAVCEKIESFLKTHLRSPNFIRIKKLAEKFDLKELNNSCDEFALTYLHLISREADFGTLDFEYVKFILPHAIHEEEKVWSLLRWTKYDLENRRSNFSKNCDLVDIIKLPSAYCKSYLLKEPLCYECAEFMEAVNGSTDMIVHDVSLLRYAPNSGSPISAIILFNTMHTCLMSYQPSNGKWYKEFLLQKDMVDAGFCVTIIVANYLYVLTPNGKLYRISVFSGNAEWEKLETFPHGYSQNICAAALGEVIYVSGGCHKGCFNIAKMKWEKFATGRLESANSTLVECGDYIYTVGGGISRTSILKSVYRYSPRSRSWSSVACMNMARDTPAAICYKEKIYVAGGCNNADGFVESTESYSPATDTWTLLSPMKVPRLISSTESNRANFDSWTRSSATYIPHNYFKLVVADDKLFAIRYNDIVVYDEAADEWKHHCKHPFPVGLVRSASIGIKILPKVQTSHRPTSQRSADQQQCQKRLMPRSDKDITPNKRISF